MSEALNVAPDGWSVRLERQDFHLSPLGRHGLVPRCRGREGGRDTARWLAWVIIEVATREVSSVRDSIPASWLR